MNVNTGELILQRLITQDMKAEFIPVPEEHEEEATKILNGEERAFVDMESGSPLAIWAKAKRTGRDPKDKSKRSMRKKSQRANRRK